MAFSKFHVLSTLVAEELKRPAHRFAVRCAGASILCPNARSAVDAAEAEGLTRFMRVQADGSVNQVDKQRSGWWVRHSFVQDPEIDLGDCDIALDLAQDHIDRHALRLIERRDELRSAIRDARPDPSTQPQLLTLKEFTARAWVQRPEGLKRRWEVRFGFWWSGSDAKTEADAIREAHRKAVNDALLLNTPGFSFYEAVNASYPPEDVLADYPDLVKRYPDAKDYLSRLDRDLATVDIQAFRRIERDYVAEHAGVIVAENALYYPAYKAELNRHADVAAKVAVIYHQHNRCMVSKEERKERLLQAAA